MELDIDKLKRQRRLNVQEQTALSKGAILSEARYWWKNGIPKPLAELFRTKGIEKYIVLDYEQDYPGISTDIGLILTSERQFFEFDVDLNAERTELLKVYSWTNVSSKFDIAKGKKGIGKTYGYLAIEVLRELTEVD